jgi:hypothetical protein
VTCDVHTATFVCDSPRFLSIAASSSRGEEEKSFFFFQRKVAGLLNGDGIEDDISSFKAKVPSNSP